MKDIFEIPVKELVTDREWQRITAPSCDATDTISSTTTLGIISAEQLSCVALILCQSMGRVPAGFLCVVALNELCQRAEEIILLP